MKEKCPLCDTTYAAMHTETQCLNIRLTAANKKIINLEIAIEKWKDSWYNYRGLIGRIAARLYNSNIDVRLD